MSQPASASGIRFEAVSVAYKSVTVLDSFSLTVRPGEIMALIGPSGSGKTTALRAVAGFVRPTQGRVWIGDTDVTDLPPRARDIGMVVQSYALFPHMKVDENVAFGLRARNADKDLIAKRVSEVLAMVGMAAFAARYPRELSGGQQQRVAIARALAVRPRVLLLDEPLSALDAQMRRDMLTELARLHLELPDLTVLYVTHDQIEALTLGDSIAILRDGRLVASGASDTMYRAPPNRFAAEFLGRANILPVRIEAQDGGTNLVTVRFGEIALAATAPPLGTTRPDCLLCVRPYAISLVRGEGDENTLPGVVRSVQWQGDKESLELDVGGTMLHLTCPPLRHPPAPGSAAIAYFRPDDAILIPADV